MKRTLLVLLAIIILSAGTVALIIDSMQSEPPSPEPVNPTSVLPVATSEIPAAPPLDLPKAPDGTVYVTVVIDGEAVLAAQPVVPDLMTFEGAIAAAHDAYYDGGAEAGFEARRNDEFGMRLIHKLWGVVPYVPAFAMLKNDSPLSNLATIPIDVAPVSTGDNIIVGHASPQVTLSVRQSGYNVRVTATEWGVNLTTYEYEPIPFANADVVDAASGTVLGTTDANGSATITIPDSYTVTVGNVAAINISAALSRVDETPQPVRLPMELPDLSEPMPPLVLPEIPTDAVYVTLVIRGEMLFSALPVVSETMTVEGLYDALHEQHFEGGVADGFRAGTSMGGLYNVERFWGIELNGIIPTINDTPDLASSGTALKAGDNIILTDNFPLITLDATEVDGRALLNVLIFSGGAGFQPYVNAYVVDLGTNTIIGVTDVDGNALINVPEGCVVGVDGISAINLAAALTRTDE